MSFLDPLRAAVKALPFPGGNQWQGTWGYSGTRSSELFTGSNRNFAAEIGELTDASVIMCCILWIARVWPESPLVVFQNNEEGKPSIIPGHPLAELVANPNPEYSSGVLWMGSLASWILDGNAYWLITRNRLGEPVQLRYLPHFQVAPRWPQDGSEFISYYEYVIDGKTFRLPKDDVIHFRHGFDPYNERIGISPLRSVLREVLTDNEAAFYSASIMKNMGAVPAVMSPDPAVFKEAGAVIPKDRADELKDQWQRRTTGDERGKLMVQSLPVKLQGGSEFSFSPEQMAIRAVRQIPEERISAAIGVPAIVVGFGAGLDRSTYSNMHEAREQAYESCIIPTQTLFAQEVDRRLLPEWSDDARVSTGFDLSRVRVLSEDNQKLMTVAVMGYEKGLGTRGEMRTFAGLKDRGSEDDVYFPGTDPDTVAEEKEEQAAAAAERLEGMRQNGSEGVERNGNGNQPAIRSLVLDQSTDALPGGSSITLSELVAAAGAAGRKADAESLAGHGAGHTHEDGAAHKANGGDAGGGPATNGT